MKTLLLLRHAKSSWADTTLKDSQRPLNKRGVHDAPKMGKRLKKEGYCCDSVIASPAVRAYETAKSVLKEIGFNDKIMKDERLYMADIDDYLEVIADVPESIEHLMLVSHNPGTEEFFEFLTGEQVVKFPTAAYALIAIEGTWSEIKKGKLLRFDYPKSEAD
ncbi:MAG: histidine phosphatase family protein [Sulfurimonadaceae bacterium]|nr:histidine phosphatase family protein [Sulfurimonadaceae bacterium]